MAQITIAVEGTDDAEAARRLCLVTHHEAGPVFIKYGKSKLDPCLGGYNEAARHSPWLVLRDLDRDAPCAPTLVNALIASPAVGMCIRIPTPCLESWFLADRGALAQFLSIPATRITRNPDALEDAKLEMVNLARRSRSVSVRADMVPVAGLSSKVGPAYSGRMIEFASNHWDPDRAARSSQSLARCLAALRALPAV